MEQQPIRVTAPGGDYDIHVQRDLLRQAAALLPKGCPIIITNSTVAPLYGRTLAQALSGAALLQMPDGERYKTLDTVAQLYRDLVAARADRDSVIIALGGGVVGDTVGFVAATYMRGVAFVQIPTTLLAMVDSSVGGKVGVDLPEGKNLVGAFKQPDSVLIDPDVLDTLPLAEWRCGMAETYKHYLLSASEGLAALDAPGIDRADMIRAAVQVKVDVVQQDPFEKNIRAHLNLGHTFAHAVEQVSGYAWLHGEAVGAGLVAAARLSAALQHCDAALVQQVEETVARIGLPTRFGDLNAERLYAAMATDKKWQGGRSRFVLLRGVGQPFVAHDVPKSVVMSILEGMR